MLPEIGGSAFHVRLGPLGPDHAPAMEMWAGDPQIADNVGIRGPVSLQSTATWIAAALDDDSCRPLAILLDGRHVGNVILDRIDAELGTARLSIYVGETDVRGRGVGRQAVRLALAEAFDALGLDKVWLTVHVRNAAAIAVYASCGFAVEGVLRGEFLLAGERVDALRMAIRRADVIPT